MVRDYLEALIFNIVNLQIRLVISFFGDHSIINCYFNLVGGEKHTGGGRESGSDAWKAYMRRSTW